MADPPELTIVAKWLPSGGFTSNFTGIARSLDLREVYIHEPHPRIAATVIAAASTNGQRLVRLATAAVSCGGVFKSSTTSLIDCQRSSGSFARHRRTSR